MSAKNRPARSARQALKPEQLRWRCRPGSFSFKTTSEMTDCPISIIGQDRAMEALRLGLTMRSEGYNIFVTGQVGSGRSTVVRRMLHALDRGERAPEDLVYLHNFQDADQPLKVVLPAGDGRKLRQAMDELIETLHQELPALFDSEEYRKHRSVLIDAATREQKARLKEFEKKVQEEGFALVQVQMGPLTRPQLVPVVAGNPVDMDQLESLVEQGQFKQKDFEKMSAKRSDLAVEMESLGKQFRNVDRDVRHRLETLDRELARALIEEVAGLVADAFSSVEGLESYIDGVVADVLDNLGWFREGGEAAAEAGALPGQERPERATPLERYRVNVLVDNAKTRGLPIIWETAPSYRNLFGTIEKRRTQNGEWETDHMHIKAGSLPRANGGILVLDAMDVLVEPGVWAALKRSLRNRRVEIQSHDPLQLFTALSLKPEALPLDVKVVMIGTRHIYRVLHQMDEDFKKIFKVKSEFAMHTERSEGELWNYACFVHKKVKDDHLLPFHRDAVAAVCEHGVRLSGDQERLTTRFTEIADLIREAGYWAAREKTKTVREAHVEQALQQRVYRVSLFEELLRERIAEGTVLMDLAGAHVGQINGLAVLDQGDHVFAQPSRITASIAMGRAGIIDIDREAEMSGAIHTKGVLILTGFLRSRFAQHRPLTLTASLTFEQNYGGVDGDSASSTELYALLSALSGVPIRQGIAVTGSVNQMGEIQPIGGANEKIEGFFDLCRLQQVDGTQGVMIPTRNVRHLMLRKEVVRAVREKTFQIWAVETIDEGLEVLTGVPAGVPDAEGRYPEDSIYGRVEATLDRLAREVARFGPADGSAQ